MRRALGPLLLVVLVAIGCQSPPAASDPFLRARVPPPSTGQIGAAPPTTYATVGPPAAPTAPAGQYAPPGGMFSYGGGVSTPGAATAPPTAAPNYAGPAAPGYPAPNTLPSYPPPGAAPPTAPGAMTPYQPPAALPAATPPATPPRYAPPGSGWGPSSSTGAGAGAGQSVSSRDRSAIRLRPLSQTIDERRLASAAGTRNADADALPSEQSLGVPDRLADAPVAGPLQGGRASRDIEPASYKASQGDVERVKRSVYTQNRDDRDAVAVADDDEDESAAVRRGDPASKTTRPAPEVGARGPADQGATYGYDGNYAWLEGRLEYAAATRQWKLRYIPIDGPTDRFGGSVVLAETPALAGYRSGDFVSIKGRLDGRASPQGTYAPLYQVSEVHRLTD